MHPVLILLLLCSLAACGDKDDDAPPTGGGLADTGPGDDDSTDDTDSPDDTDGPGDTGDTGSPDSGDGTLGDEDGDGVSVSAGDCDDTDSSINPAAMEACDDGVDQDCDGLVDCEDGDCALDPSCVEDCSTPSDEDGDGLAGCLDDDCWGTVHCNAIAALQIHSGQATYAVYHDASEICSFNLASLSGEVRFGRTSTTAVTSTCAWTGRMSFYTRHFSSCFLSGMALTDASISLSSECGMSELPDTFYPQRVFIRPRATASFDFPSGLQAGRWDLTRTSTHRVHYYARSGFQITGSGTSFINELSIP